MLKVIPSAVLALTLILFQSSQANAETRQELVDRISQEIDVIGNTPRGCSGVLAHLEVLRVAHPQFSFYFAGRTDDTPTGMRGCGYGCHTDDAIAQSRAFAGCKKWETEFGTDGGTKACRLMP